MRIFNFSAALMRVLLIGPKILVSREFIFEKPVPGKVQFSHCMLYVCAIVVIKLVFHQDIESVQLTLTANTS